MFQLYQDKRWYLVWETVCFPSWRSALHPCNLDVNVKTFQLNNLQWMGFQILLVLKYEKSLFFSGSPWGVGWRVSLSVSVSHCVASSLCTHHRSQCSFIFVQLHGNSLPLHWISMRFTCRMFVWVEVTFSFSTGTRAFSTSHSSLAYVNPHSLCIYHSTEKFNWEVWWMWVSSKHTLIYFFFADTHCLYWVTHGCHLFKKPSTWIYM